MNAADVDGGGVGAESGAGTPALDTRWAGSFRRGRKYGCDLRVKEG